MVRGGDVGAVEVGAADWSVMTEPTPDVTLMRESESWPIRIRVDFQADMTTTNMNAFADWMAASGGPGPCRRLVHFRDRTVTLAFPHDVDPAVMSWWKQELARQREAVANVVVLSAAD